MNKMCQMYGAALLLIATPVAAGTTGDSQNASANRFYVGGMLGLAEGEVGDQQMNQRLLELGYDVNASVSGRTRTAWAGFAGYRWSPYFSTEMAYVDLGEVRTRLVGAVEDINAYLGDANQVHPRSISGYELAILLRYPLSERWSVFARGGVLAGDSRYRASTQTEMARRSDSDTKFTYGAGTEYDFGSRWSGRLAMHQYSVEGERINVIGASLIYRFGLFDEDKPVPQRKQEPVRQISQQATFPHTLELEPRNTISPPTNPPKAPEQAPQVVSIRMEVLFATDSAEVRPEYYPEIRRVAEFLTQHPKATAVIEGHTDARGSVRHNQQLSQRRAAEVRQVLIERMGISAERLEAVGYGEARLLEQGDTPTAHKANRRVVAEISLAPAKP